MANDKYDDDHVTSSSTRTQSSSFVTTTRVCAAASSGKTKIRAILFDLDGTLLETESLSDVALLRALLKESSTPEEQVDEIISTMQLPWELKRQILGLRSVEWGPIAIRYAQTHWSHLLSLRTTPVPTVTELASLWEQNLTTVCEERGLRACPGAESLVHALAELGYPLAIATSSRRNAVQHKRHNYESHHYDSLLAENHHPATSDQLSPSLFRHIPTIVTGEDVVHGKPAPDIYIEAARRLGVHPWECLVFEDAWSGVCAAKAAGCSVVAVPDPRYFLASSLEEDSSTCKSPSSSATMKMFQEMADVVLKSLEEFTGHPFGIDLDMTTKTSKSSQSPPNS
jgi:beta-phosphoglucomutase-like phosphatase (HAD superfamily)